MASLCTCPVSRKKMFVCRNFNPLKDYKYTIMYKTNECKKFINATFRALRWSKVEVFFFSFLLAQRRHAVQAEAGQYGSYDNMICNYSPHRDRGKQCTYEKLDERNNHRDSEGEEDDETKALIPPCGRFPFRRKRTRLFTYPFSELKADDSESDENICDIEQDSSLSLSKRYSYPDVSFTKVSIQNNILDSGITDFTSRQEPHKILLSFNVPDKNRVIEKVQTWDCKYNWSDKNNHRRTFSAYNFLETHASGQESALKKVRGWENKGSNVIMYTVALGFESTLME